MKETITVRIEPETRESLDAIAAILNRWQIEHIEQGLREAKAGQFATECEVTDTIDRLRRR